MKNRYAIVNDVDRPCEEFVAQLTPSGKLRYMNPRLAHYPDFAADCATFLDDFGIVVIEGDSIVTFVQAATSTATYPNGDRRYWQGSKFFQMPRREFECAALNVEA